MMGLKKIANYFNKNDDVIKTLNKLLMFNTKKLKIKGFVDYEDEDFIDFIKKLSYDINSLYEFFTLFDLTCIGKEIDNKDINNVLITYYENDNVDELIIRFIDDEDELNEMFFTIERKRAKDLKKG